MQITITATLTEEQVSILATVKWYQSTISVGHIGELTIIQNPQSRADFIAEQYNRLISTDAENEYIRYAKKQREEAELAEENAIREQVKASISSSIWN